MLYFLLVDGLIEDEVYADSAEEATVKFKASHPSLESIVIVSELDYLPF